MNQALNQALSRSQRIQCAIEPLIFARRGWAMGLLLAITALLAVEALQIKSDAGFDKSIPLHHPYMQVLKQYQSDFGGANTVLIALMQKDGDIYNEQFLARLKAVSERVSALQGVDRARVSSLFTPDVRFIEVVDGGFKGGSVIPADYTPTPPMFDLIRGNVAKGGHIGRYVSSDQRGAMIFAELREHDAATGKKLDYREVAAKLESIRKQYEGDGISVHIVGFAKLVGDVLDAKQQLLMFFALTLVLGFALPWLYLGSFRLALLPLLCSVTAVIWTFGLLRLFGYGLDPFAILVPLLILAISLSHGLQSINVWIGEVAEHQRSALDASLHSWRRLAIYGTFAILANLAGFATIGLVPIGIVREMAIGACFGMTAILVANQLMMPILLSWVRVADPQAFAARQQRRDAMFDGLWRLLSNMVRPRAAITAMLISAALLGGALWKGRGLQIGSDQPGASELRPDSRYNQDFRALDANFAAGVDVLKVVAETDAEACVKFEVMEQIDRFAWHLDNTAGVASTLSLPQAAKVANEAFSESNPKYRTLPRNQPLMVQALSPIPAASGLLNPDCSAMAVFAFMQDHRAATIDRVVEQVERYNKENASAYYETHKDVDYKYCGAKLAARRDAGAAPDKLAGFAKACPVNFALAGGNVGVMAAANQEVRRLQKPTLIYVCIAIIVCVYLAFFELSSVVAILLPLSLVSWMAYALMSLAGIGLKAATLPLVPLAVGIGVDYGIYVYAAMKRELASGCRMQEAYYRTLKLSGKAVIFTGITLSLGVAAWLGSGLQLQRDVGLLLVFMLTANMLGAILLLPAIASFLLREHKP
jgi:predicted RND superfamily exporter protein